MVKDLAEEIAMMELQYKIELGEYKFTKIWNKNIEECHGPQFNYTLSRQGEGVFTSLVSKWMEKIKKHLNYEGWSNKDDE